MQPGGRHPGAQPTYADLAALVAQQAAVIAKMSARIDELEAQVAELQEQVASNSHNSSKPPSSDPASIKRHPKPPTGRAPGGQPGHQGSHRPLLPTKDVDKVVKVTPDSCAKCSSKRLRGTDAAPDRHQVAEIPPVRPFVTEYQMCEAECLDCGRRSRAELPSDVPRGAFGPRAQAIVAYLTGACHLSRRTATQAMDDLFGLDMALGSVANSEQVACAALNEPFQEAHRHAQAQQVAYADESGWREGRGKAWLWVMATGLVTVFMICRGRGHDAARQLLGTFSGILVSDRWKVYDRWAMWMRQLCWAHLMRAFVKFSERGGNSAEIGDALTSELQTMFSWWHCVRDGTTKRSTFAKKMRPLQTRVRALLVRGRDDCTNAKTRGTCREILKLEPALWTFVTEEGVEPTNNTGERAIRSGVIWRKISFGTHSEGGSRYAERMLTATLSLRQQGRNVLDYLAECMTSHLHGRAVPSLIPVRAIGKRAA